MHHRPANALFILICSLFVGTANADPDYIYLEEDGVILLDVEDAEPVEGWVLKTDLANHEGSGYFEWSGPDSFPVSAAGKGNITYHFRVQTAGNYEIRWRSQIAIGDSKTEANDSWIRFVTGDDVPEQHPLDGWTKVYMNTIGNWTWSTRTVDHVGEPLRQYFAQGDHTLEISGRSIGHAIDRITLYRYEDIDFSDSAVNRWELSSVVTGDGTVVSPEVITEPQDPDPDTTPPVVPVVRENLYIADLGWQDQANNQCIDNTLTLPASMTLSVDSADPESDYNSAGYLTISAGESSVLMKFDLSLVPPANTTVIEYTTGLQASNGTIHYSLGSHSDWQEGSGSGVQQPDVMVALSQASGGWDAQTRHQSTVPSDLLAQGNNTIIMSSSVAESEPLDIFALSSSDLIPRLLLSGGDNFCRDWQANVTALNAPAEPPAEVEENSEISPPTLEPEIEVEAESKKVAQGGSLSWLVLMVVTLAIGGRVGPGLISVVKLPDGS